MLIEGLIYIPSIEELYLGMALIGREVKWNVYLWREQSERYYPRTRKVPYTKITPRGKNIVILIYI